MTEPSDTLIREPDALTLATSIRDGLIASGIEAPAARLMAVSRIRDRMQAEVMTAVEFIHCALHEQAP
jgi:hypothetical protein